MMLKHTQKLILHIFAAKYVDFFKFESKIKRICIADVFEWYLPTTPEVKQPDVLPLPKVRYLLHAKMSADGGTTPTFSHLETELSVLVNLGGGILSDAN